MKPLINILFDCSENDSSLLNIHTRIVLLDYNLTLAGIKHKIYLIVDTGVSDYKRNEYKKKYKSELIEAEANFAKTFNSFMRLVDTDYMVYLPANIHLENSWLYELFYYHTKIQKTGISSICSQTIKGYHQPLLDKDNQLTDVYVCEYLSGLIMLDFTLVTEIGAFNEEISDKPAAIFDYCHRSQLKGFNNYNIPMHNAISNDKLKAPPPAVKNAKPFIQLYKRSKNQIKAFNYLSNLVLGLYDKNAKQYENKSTANFGLELDYLTLIDYDKIKDYAETYNLTFIVSPSSHDKLKVIILNKQ